MKPIAIFYHAVFFKKDGGAWQRSGPVISQQMKELEDSGLMAEQKHFVAGINGGKESEVYAACYIPKAKAIFNGLDSTHQTYTIQAMYDWCVEHPGWYVLFFHAKSVGHESKEYESYLPFEMRWMRCMTNACIVNWRQCVADLDSGYESVGCHWMENVGVPPVDNIWGGTFYWVTSDFVATLPEPLESYTVKEYGIEHPQARSLSERWIGMGPRLPKIKDYHVNGIGSCP